MNVSTLSFVGLPKLGFLRFVRKIALKEKGLPDDEAGPAECEVEESLSITPNFVAKEWLGKNGFH